MSTNTIFHLADDQATYGPDAGKWIVTSTDHDKEHSGPMNQRDAEAYAGMLEALEGVTRILEAVRYTVGLKGTQLERLEQAKAAIARGRGEATPQRKWHKESA